MRACLVLLFLIIAFPVVSGCTTKDPEPVVIKEKVMDRLKKNTNETKPN